jgi:acetyltransferase-like isoleucine patch superfamily enzyme
MVQDLSEVFLTTRLWSFGHLGASPQSFLRFLPNGDIGLYDSFNERRWRLEDGVLCVINALGVVTARFDLVECNGNLFELSGPHLPNPAIVLYLREQGMQWPTCDGTRETLAQEMHTYGWSIGEHTYGTPNVLEPAADRLVIGKYTSIAGGCTICLANHRVDNISTYQFTTLKGYWPSAPINVSDHVSKGEVRIGNDVWIGSGVFIGSGVKIGDGAVIGAHAVVTLDVPAYAIAVGNPAKVTRYRFSEAVVSKLVKIAWWDWPARVVDSYLPLMFAGDVDAFITAGQHAVFAEDGIT